LSARRSAQGAVPAPPLRPPRGRPKDPEDPTLRRWGQEPPFAAEHDGTLVELERDATYRWIVPAAAGRTVLDVGCGPGHGLALLLDAGAKAGVGTDSDPRNVGAASELYGDRFRVHLAAPEEPPDGPFGLIVCDSPVAEATDPAGLVDALAAALEPDGVLVLALDPEEAQRTGLERRFANVSFARRRACLGVSVSGENPAGTELGEARWLAGAPGEERALLAIASDEQMLALPPVTSLADFRDLRDFRALLQAWEQRAREAEAEGSAKHWELVAAREAQRRLRRRLFELEHRPLRTVLRMLKGGPRKVGPGPPIRASERGPETWD
jgi:SAM-dependent methyltransferase